MPEQPNHCTGCNKLMPDTNAAYYCSEACMHKVLGTKPILRRDMRIKITDERLREVAKQILMLDVVAFDEGLFPEFAPAHWPYPEIADGENKAIAILRKLIEDTN